MKRNWIALFFLFVCLSFCQAAQTLLIPVSEAPTYLGFHAVGKGDSAYLDADNARGYCIVKTSLPEDGTYFLYVRHLTYGDGGRKMGVWVDGTRIGSVQDSVSGCSGAAWIWSKVPQPLVRKAGPVKLKVTVESGKPKPHSFLLTTDPGFRPPEDGSIPQDKALTVVRLGASQQTAAQVTMRVRTDKNPVSYHCGEPIRFLVEPPMIDGVPVSDYLIEWKAETDDGEHFSGTKRGSGTTLEFPFVMKQPGFVHFEAWVFPGNEEEANQGWRGPQLTYNGGAGADISQVRSMPEPKDFDAYWASQKALLATEPLQAEVVKIGETKDGACDIYTVKVKCLQWQPMTGYMTIPKNAAPGSLKAEAVYQGYGLGVQRKPVNGSKNLKLEINAHGYDLEQSPEYYQKFLMPLKGYALNDGTDVNTFYFRGMVMRLLRSLQFLKSRPEWNGKDLLARGSSQGGAQAIWAAGLDPDVTECQSNIPWCGNIGGYTLGLNRRQGCHMEYTPAYGYFDSSFHAKRIHVKTTITRASLGDRICTPASVSRIYFNLNGPKSIIYVQDSDHGAPVPKPRDVVTIVNEEIPEN